MLKLLSHTLSSSLTSKAKAPSMLNLNKQMGLTLLEVSVVLIVLIGLAGLALPYVNGTGVFAQCTSTEATMLAIRNAIVGSIEQPGYSEDMKGLAAITQGLPANLQGLMAQDYCEENGFLLTQVACTGAGNTWSIQPTYNPHTQRGWRGPYLSSEIIDAFNLNPIVLQTPVATQNARLVSLGPNGTLNTGAADDDAAPRGDDRILFLFLPDPNANLTTNCVDL